MKSILILLFVLTLTVRVNGQSQQPKNYIESVGKTQWKVIGNDTAVYMIQKDPYQPRLTRMVWVNKKEVSHYRIRLYTVAQMDSIRALTP